MSDAMIDPSRLNDGSRPSRLELDRQLTGELAVQDPAALDAHRAQLQASQTALPAFNAATLRARAATLSDAPTQDADASDSPADSSAGSVHRLRPWMAAVPLLAAALALFFLIIPQDINPGVGPDLIGNRAKGTVDLDLYVQREGRAQAVDKGQLLHAGDRVRFALSADGHESVVLLSVDGRGTVTLFYPEDESDPPVAIDPDRRALLDGAVMLDDAPGPELFVAVFSPASTADALSLVRAAADRGGQAALLDLSHSDPGLAMASIGKSP